MRTIVALCLIGFVTGFSGSLAVHLPNIALQRSGVSGTLIGFSTGVQALGIVIGAFSSVWLLGRISTALVTAGACLWAAAGLAGMGASASFDEVSLWRFVFALGLGTAVSASEYVLVV